MTKAGVEVRAAAGAAAGAVVPAQKRTQSATHLLAAPGQLRRVLMVLRALLVARPSRDELSASGRGTGLYLRTLSPVERTVMLLLPRMAPLPPSEWPLVFDHLLGYATSPRSTAAFSLRSVMVLRDLYGSDLSRSTAMARAGVFERVVNSLAGMVRARCGGGDGGGDGDGSGDGGGGQATGRGSGAYAAKVEQEVAQEVWEGAVAALLTVVEAGLPALAQCGWSQAKVEAAWVLLLKTLCGFFVLPQGDVAVSGGGGSGGGGGDDPGLDDGDGSGGGGGAAAAAATAGKDPVDIALLNRVMDQAVPLLLAGLVPPEVQNAVLQLLADGAGNANAEEAKGQGRGEEQEQPAVTVATAAELERKRRFRHACLRHLFGLARGTGGAAAGEGAEAGEAGKKVVSAAAAVLETHTVFLLGRFIRLNCSSNGHGAGVGVGKSSAAAADATADTAFILRMMLDDDAGDAPAAIRSLQTSLLPLLLDSIACWPASSGGNGGNGDSVAPAQAVCLLLRDVLRKMLLPGQAVSGGAAGAKKGSL